MCVNDKVMPIKLSGMVWWKVADRDCDEDIYNAARFIRFIMQQNYKKLFLTKRECFFKINWLNLLVSLKIYGRL